MLNHVSSQSKQTALFRRRSRAILITLLFPTIATTLNGSMFAVALPTIRDEFNMSADVVAWLTIAFMLPFMMLMPLYGRLGDDLGQPRLLVIGIVIFTAGSVLALSASDLPQIFIGQVVQGAGSAGITPLSLAIIARRFSAAERGRALGNWTSSGLATAIFAPFIGGWLVDSLGWRTIFIPAIVVALLAIIIVRWQIPTLREKPNWAQLRAFDWGAVPLLSGTVIFLILFVSSRPVTGIEPLQDWRLLFGSLLFGAGFVTWERRRSDPLVDLHLLQDRGFRLASLLASLRLGIMVGIGFLMPLYLADVYDLNASTIGLMLMANTIAAFLFIRWGGSLADRWSNRWLVTISFALQLSVMIYFALLPGEKSLLWIVVGVTIHGLGAGLSLAALHRIALGSVPAEKIGAAAGVYLMTRFSGLMLGTAMAGVILQSGLDRGLRPIEAYQIVYVALAAISLIGVFVAFRLRD